MLFKGRYKRQDYFQTFRHLFSVTSFICRKSKRAYSCLPSKDSLNYSLSLYKDGFTYGFILFSTKCFLFVYMYIDLLKLQAYKLFKNSEAHLSWLLFFRSQLVLGFTTTSTVKVIFWRLVTHMRFLAFSHQY